MSKTSSLTTISPIFGETSSGPCKTMLSSCAQHPNIKFTIEGHCDERGSIEYNLALGDNRANSAKQALVAAGVGADRIQTVSYGKERSFCTEHNEECWQQNRRARFVYQK